MYNNNLRKVLGLIFLPATILSFLLATSSALFAFASKNIVAEKLIDISMIPYLKTSLIIPQLIFVIAVLFTSKYFSFEKIFRWTLGGFIGVVYFLVGFTLFQEYLQYELMPKSWFTSLLYVVLNLLNFNLSSLLIWGFINRFTSLAEGIKYYISVAFVFAVVNSLINTFVPLVFRSASWSSVVVLGVLLVIFALLTFNWAWKKIPNLTDADESLTESKKGFPFLYAAYILVASVMINQLLKLDSYAIVFPESELYHAFLRSLSLSEVYSEILASIVCVSLGSWLLLKKGWRTAALFGSLSIFIVGLTFLGFSYTTETPSGINYGVFSGLLMGTTDILFFPLIQVAYLYMPAHDRFKAKVVTEMVALPLIKVVPTLLIQVLIVSFGAFNQLGPYMTAVILVMLVLLVIASRKAGSKLMKPTGQLV